MTGEVNNRDSVLQACIRDPLVRNLSECAIGGALSGLGVKPVKSITWIADAVRVAVHFGSRFADRQDGKKGKAAVQQELLDLSMRLRTLWVSLFEISPEADEAIQDLAWNREATNTEVDVRIDLLPTYRTFKDVGSKLEWMGLLLRDAATEVGAMAASRRWTEAEGKRLRIVLAHHLAPIFEAAYGRAATYKNGGSNHQPASFGIWPDFLYRILRLAEIDKASTNFEEVLREARRLHRSERVLFAPGILPD